MSKLGRPKKTIKQYEAEAVRVGKCLVHPSYGVGRGIDWSILVVFGVGAINSEMENYLVGDLRKRVKNLEEKK